MPRQLAIFDTLRGKKVPFEPIRPGRVGMFVCGPTVQGRMHLGHAKTYTFYDVMAKHLSALGYGVEFVMNVTDIDESISRAAAQEGVTPADLALKYERLFLGDMKRLGIDTVTRVERVSKRIPEMKREIEMLMKAGHAYARDGWVYFDTSTFRGFGELSHQSREELSLRPLELSTRKRNLLDFSLWRPEVLVQGRWRSPWGLGSPGWHIQDTAVTEATLGSQYDIHGGAYELIYPHHEAEIAQGECLAGKSPLVRYWVHTHMVNQGGEKMSKSAGNVFTVDDALKEYSRGEIRFFLLAEHYRRDVDLSGLPSRARAHRSLRRRAIASNRGRAGEPSEEFMSAMNDDFDTPRALVVIEEELEAGSRASLASARAESAILGLDLFAKA